MTGRHLAAYQLLAAAWNLPSPGPDVLPVPCEDCHGEGNSEGWACRCAMTPKPAPAPAARKEFPMIRRSATDHEFTFDPVSEKWTMTLITVLGSTEQARIIIPHFGLEAEAAFDEAQAELEESYRDTPGAEATAVYDQSRGVA